MEASLPPAYVSFPPFLTLPALTLTSTTSSSLIRICVSEFSSTSSLELSLNEASKDSLVNVSAFTPDAMNLFLTRHLQILGFLRTFFPLPHYCQHWDFSHQLQHSRFPSSGTLSPTTLRFSKGITWYWGLSNELAT